MHVMLILLFFQNNFCIKHFKLAFYEMHMKYFIYVIYINKCKLALKTVTYVYTMKVHANNKHLNFIYGSLHTFFFQPSLTFDLLTSLSGQFRRVVIGGGDCGESGHGGQLLQEAVRYKFSISL